MRIIEVTKKELIRFVDFPDRLYRGDVNYVPYMRRDLIRTLRELLFEKRTYAALLAVDEKNCVLGRVLFTVDKNKQLKTEKCGFFSMYECVDDMTVSRALLDTMTQKLTKLGAEYASGTYYPYDPDNRRGIMVRGFDCPPLIFTSYNPPYYDDQMTDAGFVKQIDTYEFSGTIDEKTRARLARISEYSMRRHGFHIDNPDFDNIGRDIDDICTVMAAATNEINYQDAPTREMLEKIFRGWKSFLDPTLIQIARRDEDQRPVGIAVSLPDYFQVFGKMRGRIGPLGLLRMASERKKIRSYRGILQYVIPEYQKTGVLPAMYLRTDEAARKRGMTYSEAGTIMENNRDSIAPLENAGAELARVYRIYYKKLREE